MIVVLSILMTKCVWQESMDLFNIKLVEYQQTTKNLLDDGKLIDNMKNIIYMNLLNML